MKLHEIAHPHNQIEAWLKKYKIEDYIINPDGTVDVEGNVSLSNTDITSFPFQFRRVSGHFYCYDTKITSLQGAPQSVGGGFYCSGTNITSLEGAPQSVGGNFYCQNSKITSLQGAPQSIGGTFNCFYTRVTSLSGVDKIIKRISGVFVTSENVTHVLGLVLIPGINSVNITYNVDKIMNKYVGTGDILSCQDELIDAGFVEQARL